MKVLRTIDALRAELNTLNQKEKIGLVPTMGALHQGHISLIKKSVGRCECTVATIFVNPAQFNNPEDLEKYPKTIDYDLEQLRNANCDIVFLPEASEIYPKTPEVKIDLGPIAVELEGKFRPGHFNGVALVISKLFNIVQPNEAFFGQKDIQQYHVIKKLARELNFPVEVFMVATEREVNGLAMSSRNLRLSDAERDEASLIYRSLKQARQMLLEQKSIAETKAQVTDNFQHSNLLELEYFEIVNTSQFLPLAKVEDQKSTALCMAAVIGGVRLIDNLPLVD